MSNWIDPKPIQHKHKSYLSHLDPIVIDRIAFLGLETEQQAIAFLDPSRFISSTPEELIGLSKVADRVESAIINSEPICVWGDFDVDGQTSTTILLSTLNELGARVSYHIPVRGPESHGIGIPQLEKIIRQGIKLILTCDTGITAHEAIEYANSQGVNVVITDHHDLPPNLPPALAATNPKFLDRGHPLSTLAGAGVAYKLAEELYTRFGLHKQVEKHLDLVALGLIADLAELKGDTRYLVQLGLQSLQNTQRLGLQVLMETAELNPDHLTEEHIGFVIGPRLNALGRLADANIAVELLTTSDKSRARVIVTILEGLNAQRKLLTNQVYSAAEEQLRIDPSLLEKASIVLAHPEWPSGIIGIAASRLAEKYNRPVILISNPPGQFARGSARSIEGINVTEAIAAHRELLLGFGGHPMAAGLTIDSEKIPEFQRKFSKTMNKLITDMDMEKIIQLDGIYKLDELNMELADSIEKLAPFGPGNPKLILATKNLKVKNFSRIGRQSDHYKFIVEDEKGNQQEVLWWNAMEGELPEERIDLAYNLRSSDWRGSRQLQLEYVDCRISHQTLAPPKKSQIKIVDLRENDDIKTILGSLPSGSLVWIEGEEKSIVTPDFKKNYPKVLFSNRNELVPSSIFAIWTPPSSPRELEIALEIVNPDQVFLLKGSMASTTPENFMGQLMGMIKFILNHRNGMITFAELAAATSQRESTVRGAIRWMVYQGEISILQEFGKQITLGKGTSLKDPTRASGYWEEVKNLIDETEAYRAHFIKADKDSLFH